MKALAAALLIASAAAMIHERCEAFPIAVQNCSETERFDRAPERGLVNDVNNVQTILDLGLSDRLVGVSGIAGLESHLVGSPASIASLHQIAPRYPSLEAVLAQHPDFMFAGWRYGFSLATAVTPQSLAGFGIASYALRESCIRVGPREAISMQTLYADLDALGAIFGIESRVGAMVAGLRARVADVLARVRTADRPRVMYCSDCDSDAPPLSVGAEGMTALITRLAGGTNIFDDIEDSYVRVNWEEVVARDPQWIIVSDHDIPASRIIRHLTSAPELARVDAIRHRRFVILTYAEQTPSTRSVDGLEKIARALHPDRFAP